MGNSISSKRIFSLISLVNAIVLINYLLFNGFES